MERLTANPEAFELAQELADRLDALGGFAHHPDGSAVQRILKEDPEAARLAIEIDRRLEQQDQEKRRVGQSEVGAASRSLDTHTAGRAGKDR